MCVFVCVQSVCDVCMYMCVKGVYVLACMYLKQKFHALEMVCMRVCVCVCACMYVYR